MIAPAVATASPLVTVVIPTRNRASDVVRSVRAMLANDGPTFEVRVVDQSDDDSTHDALRGLLADVRLTYLRSPERGVSSARNLGCATARGTLIGFTDDDCEPSPGWVADIVAAFGLDPEIGMVFGSVLAA